MKVLVTGKEGQLVKSLLERAEGRIGLELIALGRPELDLETPGSATRAIKHALPDVVVNAAAYTAVDQAEDEPDRAFRLNGEAAGEVAAAANALGARIIHISTDYVFDGRSQNAYDENARVNPLSVYGSSKLKGEDRVREENPKSVIVRTAWVYSPFGRNFLKTMMSLARNEAPVSVVNDQFGNPSSALDLADGLLTLLSRWKARDSVGLGEVYHLAGTGSASWFEFASVIFEEMRSLALASAVIQPTSTAGWPTKATRPKNSRLDSSKFREQLEFQMPAWEQSARHLVRRLAAA